LFVPSFTIDNIFDKKYLLKGAFFSGASVGKTAGVSGQTEYLTVECIIAP